MESDKNILDVYCSDTEFNGSHSGSTVKAKEHSVRCKRYIITDGIIGDKIEDSDIELIYEPECRIRKACSIVKKIEQPAIILVSVGSFEASSQSMDAKDTSAGGNTILTVNRVVEKIMRPLRRTAELVNDAGGVIIMSTPFPCPKEQDITVSNNKQHMCEVISQVYVALRTEFIGLNNRLGVSGPNISWYGEKSGKRQKFKFSLQQSINLKVFKEDLVHPTVEVQHRLMKMCIKSIKHYDD